MQYGNKCFKMVQAVKDFELPYEYMYDAGKICEEYIHPDDCKEYEEDIEAVFSGKNIMI